MRWSAGGDGRMVTFNDLAEMMLKLYSVANGKFTSTLPYGILKMIQKFVHLAYYYVGGRK